MFDIRALGISVVKVSGGEEMVLCPFHRDSNPSAWFDPRKGLFWCAVCNLGLNYEQLCRRLKIEPEDLEPSESEGRIPDYDLFEDTLGPLLSGGSLIPQGIDYVSRRGISGEAAQLYGLEWSEEQKAVMFPITNMLEERIGAQYRYTSPTSPTRYRKIGEMTPLWPLHWLRLLDPSKPLLVTEGGWSAMKISSQNSGRILSLLGAHAPNSLKDLLAPFSPVFLMDDDRAGRNAAAKLKKLNPLWRVFTLPTAPDDLEPEDIRALLKGLGL